MGSNYSVAMDIMPVLRQFAGDDIKKANQMARDIAKQLEAPLRNIGIEFNSKAVQGVKSLAKYLKEYNISLSSSIQKVKEINAITGKPEMIDKNFLNFSMQSASGVYQNVSMSRENGQFESKITSTSVARLTSTKELQQAYDSLFAAMKKVYSLEEKGDKFSPEWEHASGTLNKYEEKLQDVVDTLIKRHHLSVETNQDLGEELIAGDGKIAQIQEAMEHQRRQINLEHDSVMAKKANREQLDKEQKESAERIAQIQQYISALKEQWKQEEILAQLRKNKLPQELIDEQKKIANSATENASKLKEVVKNYKEYEDIKEEVTYLEDKHKRKINELNTEVKKSTSLFGNFISTLRQVVQAGLSWKIFSFMSQSLRKSIQAVIDLDKSLVDLQIVTNGTEEEASALLTTYSHMAQQLGSTTKEVADSAVEWQRQGYSIEQTNDLIKNSMILSKVGMIDSARSTEYLTSAMKGYNKTVDESLGIVDKLTAIDMKAAVSAGGLAEGMARTAASANMAGVSMEKLLGYLAATGEVTQKSMSQIGESEMNALIMV